MTAAADRAGVRLFFAARPDAAMQERFEAAAAAAPLDSAVRVVPRNNLHLTLAFVGEVALDQLPQVRKIGHARVRSAFSLRFDAYEYWPKPAVVVAAARQVPAALEQLWRQLHLDLAQHQWALDAKKLRPHVTLARQVAEPPVLPAMAAFEWHVREWCLMRSDTRNREPVYTVVDGWSLLDNGEML